MSLKHGICNEDDPCESEREAQHGQESPHHSCTAHPLMEWKINVVIALLIGNIFSIWVGFYKEIKPALLQISAHDAQISAVGKDAVKLEARLDRHIERENK